MTKEQLRTIALQRRDAIDAEQRRQWSENIWQKIKGLKEFQMATHVLSYASFRSEVDTKHIQEYCWQKGKYYYLPRTNPVDKTMDFYEVTSRQDLVSGYQGIQEPAGGIVFSPADKKKNDKLIMFMPGVAFDDFGNRIGYGGGYYDRYLSCFESYIDRTIFLAFDEQMVETIPAEQCDIRPMKIVTNSRR